MTDRVRTDPTVLNPLNLEFHQVTSFSLSPPPLADHLERSPLFRTVRYPRSTQAEWVRWTAEHDVSPFPFGRVTVFKDGVLCEAFGEGRMRNLRDRVDALSAWRVSPDERRIYRLHDVVEEPIVIFQPSYAPNGGERYDGRDASELFLRMAWPFFPREDLGGRTPAAVIATGRGRRTLETLLPKLPGELGKPRRRGAGDRLRRAYLVLARTAPGEHLRHLWWPRY